jgi:hypothetical protein
MTWVRISSRACSASTARTVAETASCSASLRALFQIERALGLLGQHAAGGRQFGFHKAKAHHSGFVTLDRDQRGSTLVAFLIIVIVIAQFHGRMDGLQLHRVLERAVLLLSLHAGELAFRNARFAHRVGDGAQTALADQPPDPPRTGLGQVREGPY